MNILKREKVLPSQKMILLPCFFVCLFDKLDSQMCHTCPFLFVLIKLNFLEVFTLIIVVVVLCSFSLECLSEESKSKKEKNLLFKNPGKFLATLSPKWYKITTTANNQYSFFLKEKKIIWSVKIKSNYYSSSLL